MSADLPDFTKHGYQLRTELGHNRLGGRTTYLATNSLGYPVVIKQFQFATSGSSWGEYEAYQQEITMLRHLQHPGIPRYLDAFQTPDGFCMVQQYISGESLATPRNWTPQEIKHIALATLEILTYLQSQHSPIIHRDIKPENILVDEQLKVYLVDFGFPRMGGGEIASSSVVKGTMGFMPPEQLFNRQLTTASDLYGLGATLICLLTGTKSGDIGNLIDADYQIHFQHLVPPLKRGWINWLAKITAPKVAERYPNAAAALKALEPIDVERLPKLIISHNSLQFTATKWQEKVSQIVTLSNPIPETLLAGQFSVAPHPSDPPHTPYDHAWISFQPANFEGNEVNCTIRVDTSKLLSNKTYTRNILVHSNADAEPEVITVTVQTAPLPKPISFGGWVGLVLVLVVSGFLGWGLAGNPWLMLFPVMPVMMTADRVLGAVARGIKVNVFTAFIGSLIGGVLFICLPLLVWFMVNFYFSDSGELYLFFALICVTVGCFRGANAGQVTRENFWNWILALLWIFFGVLMSVTVATDDFSNWKNLLVVYLLVFIPIVIQFWTNIKTGKLVKILNFDKVNFYSQWLCTTAIMGMGLGVHLLPILTTASKIKNNEFDWLARGNSFWQMAPIVLLGLTPTLVTGVVATSALRRELKLRKYLAQYARNELPLIKA